MTSTNGHVAYSSESRTRRAMQAEESTRNVPWSSGENVEFAEQVPEYLREGYVALMRGDADSAIEMWMSLYERFPSAEVCGHLARAHYYQIYFQNHAGNHPEHIAHVKKMRRWAERALCLNCNSSIGHAMLAGALGREAQLSGSRKEIIRSAWQVRHHAERAIEIDNNWIGHYVLALWHCELASVKPSVRTVVQLLNGRKLPRGSFDQAIWHFRQVLKQFPDNNVIFAEMASAYFTKGDLATARKYYRLCTESPMFRHPVAPFFIGQIRERFESVLATDDA